MEIVRGNHVAGTHRNLRESDNLDVSLQRAANDIQARISLELTATSPDNHPEQMMIAIEASVFARSNVLQTVELFDFDSSQWEEIDTRNASRFNDGRAYLSAPMPARFVAPTTRLVKARVRFESNVQRQLFSSNLDQFVWMIGE